MSYAIFDLKHVIIHARPSRSSPAVTTEDIFAQSLGLINYMQH